MKIEVSNGEILDKMSILKIKMDKINDKQKKENVQKEYYYLKEISKEMSYDIESYNTLLEINHKLWDIEDNIREKERNNSFGPEFIELARSVYFTNDERCRIKKIINMNSKSNFIEEKLYPVYNNKEQKALVLGHLGMGDQFYIVGIVRYLSTIYDEVTVVCKDNTKNNIKQMYSDDKSIRIYSVANDKDISPAYGFNISDFNKIFNNHTKYLLGFHQHGIHTDCYGQGKIIYDLPFSFYDDVQINHQVFWDYFHVNKPDNSIIMYNSIKNINYIFMHNTSSIGEVFSLDFIVDKFNINKDKTLIINPCICLYQPGDNYYELAKTFIKLPILEYIDTIENAKTIVMSDSSFLCLAQHLEIKTEQCYIYCREGNNYKYTYDHIWSNKYKSKSTPNKYKKFFQINNNIKHIIL